MNRIQFLKRLLATLFGAAATTSLRGEHGNPDSSRASASTQPRYLLSATVAGTPYYDYPEVGPQLFEEGQNPLGFENLSLPENPAMLKLEPDNEFDYKAIEVYWGAHKMGYIPRRHNKVLYNLLKDGAQLEAYIRLQYAFGPEDLINIAHPMDAYDLRIRVYLAATSHRQDIIGQ